MYSVSVDRAFKVASDLKQPRENLIKVRQLIKDNLQSGADKYMLLNDKKDADLFEDASVSVMDLYTKALQLEFQDENENKILIAELNGIYSKIIKKEKETHQSIESIPIKELPLDVAKLFENRYVKEVDK